jgi:hypothetical protein
VSWRGGQPFLALARSVHSRDDCLELRRTADAAKHTPPTAPLQMQRAHLPNHPPDLQDTHVDRHILWLRTLPRDPGPIGSYDSERRGWLRRIYLDNHPDNWCRNLWMRHDVDGCGVRAPWETPRRMMPPFRCVRESQPADTGLCGASPCQVMQFDSFSVDEKPRVLGRRSCWQRERDRSILSGVLLYDAAHLRCVAGHMRALWRALERRGIGVGRSV